MTDSPREIARLDAIAEYDVMGGGPLLAAAEKRELRSLCELAAALCHTPMAMVNLIDSTVLEQIAAVGGDPEICARGDSLCTTALEANEDMVVGDLSTDGRFAGSPWVDGRRSSLRYYASAIMRTPAGLPIGTLCVYDNEPRSSDRAPVEMLRNLATHAIGVLELRALRKRLERTIEELSSTQDRMAEFAGNVGHDLKTPLTTVIGFTELLSEMPAVTTNTSAVAYLGRTASSANRMLGIVEELVGYARLGAVAEKRTVRLDDVMPAVLDELGPLADRAVLRWEGVQIHADPVQLRVLLRQLIANAIMYRSPARRAEVSVVTSGAADAAELRVIDNGRGIPADQRQTVLQPLGRLRRGEPGSGMGLALCSRIVIAHGGTIRLGDSPGGGTTVTVRLPR